MVEFPSTLLRVINSEKYPHAIGWGPNGILWIDAQAFHRDVLGIHFQGVKKLASFTRKMNRYGFKRILEKDGNVDGVLRYQHDIFRQGVSEKIIVSMVRIQKKKSNIHQNKNVHPPSAVLDASRGTTQPMSTILENPAILPRFQGTAVDGDASTVLQELLLRQYISDRIVVNAALAPLSQQLLNSAVPRTNPSYMLNDFDVLSLRSIAGKMTTPVTPQGEFGGQA